MAHGFVPPPPDLGRLLFDFAEAIRPIPAKFGGPEGKHRLVSRMDQFLKEEKVRRFYQTDDVLKTDWSGHAYVRARACELLVQDADAGPPEVAFTVALIALSCAS